MSHDCALGSRQHAESHAGKDVVARPYVRTGGGPGRRSDGLGVREGEGK